MEPEKQFTLLVAEDDESNFLLLFTLLKKNYKIVRAHDGIEAIQMFKSISPDAILMDIGMPRMDGLSATQAIREVDSKIPIIAVSAFVFEQDRKDAYQFGCNAFITKPIDFRQLTSTLNLLLTVSKDA